MPDDFILTFAVPDVLLFVLGSAAASVLVLWRWSIGRLGLWFVAGATGYAALHCVGFALRGPGFGAATAMMLAASACVLVLAATSRADEPVLPRMPQATSRGSAPMNPGMRTVLQVIVFWGVFLALIPWGIHRIEVAIGLGTAGEAVELGAAVFVVGSIIGVWSSVVMVRDGKGTPLPTDAATAMVVRGPYAFVRNPMAIGGLLQGLGVAAILGSWTIAGYAALGSVLWELCVRPIEESALEERFGAAYDDYRARVRCWFVRLTPYVADRVGEDRSE